MEAKWTAAEGAGSARFSKRYRDDVREDYEEFLTDAQRLKLRIERATGVPMWALCVAALLAAGLFRLALLARAHIVSWWSARRLLADEDADTRRRNAERAATAALQRAALEPAADAGLFRVRFCRFCDCEVADEHVTSHPTGKKHVKTVKKLAEMVHLKFDTADWEEWRSGPAPAVAAAAPAIDAEDEVQIDTSSKGGKWAKQAPRRRK